MSLWGPHLEIPVPPTLALMPSSCCLFPSSSRGYHLIPCLALLQEPLTGRAQGLGYLAAPQTKAVGAAL